MPNHYLHPPRIVLVGPAVSRQGGIAAVQQLYLDNWQHQRYAVRPVSTSIEGSRWRKGWTLALALLRYLTLLLTWRPCLVHVHFGWGASFYRKSLFILLARLLKVNVLLHCHTGRFPLFYQAQVGVRRRYVHWILRIATGVAVVSEPLLSFFQTLPIPLRLFLLYNPVACPRTPPERPADGRTVVLSLGRLSQLKGTYNLLRIAPLVLQSCPTAEFWLAGAGEVAEVQALLAAQPWGRQVKILGWLAGEGKAQALSQATLFLLPTYHEGLPLALLEAMAYGLPVVTTRVGGIPDVVSEGESGYLLRPGDVDGLARRVSQLVGDAELRQRLGSQARQVVLARFQVDSILQQVYTLYDSFCL
ncbi:MAG: glycosyltransferase family 4 protein [Chloroflexota bacterium]